MTRWQRAFRFWALRFFAELTAVVGFCVMVPGIIAAVLMLQNGINLNSPPVQLAGFAVAIVAVLSGIPLIAFSQLMLCIVAIERNTDDAANYLKKMSEVPHEQRKKEGAQLRSQDTNVVVGSEGQD